MKKNDELQLVVDDNGADGEGICHHDGITIFVPFAIVGEVINVHILKVKNSIAFGKLLSVVTPSKNRVEPKCKYYKMCGGCALEHLSKDGELEAKKQKIINVFKKNAGIDLLNISMVDSIKDYGYRNKCSFPIRNIDGQNSVCMFRENSHTPIKIDKCEIAGKQINLVIKVFSEYLQEAKVSAYDDNLKAGLIKFLVVRVLNNVPLVTVVINGKTLPNKSLLIAKLSEKFEKFGLDTNINTMVSNVIFGEKLVHEYGVSELMGEENGVSYPISSLSFMQVNDEIKSKIYNDVISCFCKNDIVIDAYAGAGLLSAEIAKHVKYVYGIEIVKEATKNANELKQSNAIINLENINGDCAEKLEEVAKKVNGVFCVVLDPPRKGVDEKVIKTIIKNSAKKVVYISCNPASLARDAKFLIDAGYQIKQTTGYNMFPQTSHVETVMVFERS